MIKKNAAIAILGASKYKSAKLTSRPAFLNSKEKMERYFDDQNMYNLDERIDLFDNENSASWQINEIDKFIQTILDKDIDYLFLIYIGHGEFRATKDDYFWAVAGTDEKNPYNSSIDVKTLGHSLKKLRQTTKCVCLIDSCFSAATAGAFMSSVALRDEVSKRTKKSIATGHGSIVISSSAVDNVSYISNVAEITLFTRALVETLIKSTDTDRDEVLAINPVELVDRCEQWMLNEEPDIATSPQLIAPYQQGKSLLAERIFPILSRKMRFENDRISNEKLFVAKEIQEKSPHYPSKDEIHEINALVSLGEKLERELVLSIDKSLIKESLYAYYARTKGAVAIARKIERKRIERERESIPDPYLVSDVTDIVGLRLITLFREDTSAVLDSLCKLLVGANGGRQEVTRFNPFSEEPKIHEARAYYSDTFPGAHSYAVDAQKILASHFEVAPHNVTVEVVEKEEYSSVHIVLRVYSASSSEEDSEVLIVPVEFQIRSVFEDTWAQVDHKLRYTKTRVSSEVGGVSTSYVSVREQIPPGAERSLKLLKRFLDNSGDLAEIIRDQVEDSTPEFSKPTPSMDSAEDFSSNIQMLDGNSLDFQEFQSILLKKDELDSKYQKLGPVELSDHNKLMRLRKSYGKLAEDLNALFESAETRDKFSKFRKMDQRVTYYYYSLRMEEAFCRVFSASPSDLSEVREARNIYTQLLTDYSDYPPLHYRLAQTQKSLGDVEKAVNSMTRCIRSIDDGEYVNGKFDHKMSEKQYRAMIGNVDRLLGFYIWTKAQHILKEASTLISDDKKQSVIQLYDQAVEMSLRGIFRSGSTMKLRNLNNVVAYLNDAIALTGEKDVSKVLGSLQGRTFEEFFTEFESLIDFKSEESVKNLETLATAYRNMGRAVDAKMVARKIIEVIKNRKLIAVGEIPAEEVQEILDIALEILEGSDGIG